MLMLMLSAQAAEFGVALGAEVVTNDPFTVTFGPRVGFHLAFSPLLEVSAHGAWYPQGGGEGCDNLRWTAKTCALSEDMGVWVDVSTPELSADLTLGVMPLRAHLGEVTVAGGIEAGIGAVLTKDDPYALSFADGIEETQIESHGAAVGGVVGEVRRSRWMGRVYLRDMVYIETVASSVLEMKSATLLGLEGGAWF